MPAQGLSPGSPFLNAPSFQELESESSDNGFTEALTLEMTSPFLRIYQNESGDPIDPESEEMVELLTELYDEQFEEELAEVVLEARALRRDLHERESFPERFSAEAEQRFLDEHFEPLLREAQGLAGSMSIAFENSHEAQITDGEIDSVVDAYTPAVPLAPNFEHLFGGLKKKLKKLAKKAKKLAKKGLKAVGKLALGPLFKKLKKLIRPLLKRVLKRAIDRLPKRFRPIAHRLAKRLPFLRETEADEARVPDLAMLQLELDSELAELLVGDGEAQPAAIESRGYEDAELESMVPLDVAREQFIDRMLELEDGADPAPHVEQFVPAILGALKIAIKIAKRPRVVKFLAKLVARLIRRFVGNRLAGPLSRALVDSGLRLINLEATSEDERRAAGATVAATVEETVRRVAELPESVLDDEELLEASVLEAFEQAATSCLPPVLSEETYRERPDLREVSGRHGAWILQPLRGPKVYKKYSRSWRRRLSPQALRTIRSWNGRTLAGLMKEHMALSPGEDVEAQVHLFEALPGTMVPEICRIEKSLPGMAASGCRHCSLLHPLTERAAAVLLDEPGLGRHVSRRYRTHPRMTEAGQRFYYLEVEGAAPAAPGMNGRLRDARCSLLTVRLDLVSSRLRLRLFLSESRAQEIAAAVRSQHSAGRAVAALRRSFEPPLRAALRGDAYGRVRIVSRAVSPHLAPGPLLRKLSNSVRAALAARVLDHLSTGLAEYFRSQSRSFLDATEDQRQGVTLVVEVDDPELLAPLRAAVEARGESGNGDLLSSRPGGSVQVRAVAGCQRG